MAKLIRKISIGTDYKNEAMHYSVGQQVYGGHCISDILYDEKTTHTTYTLKKTKRFCRGRNSIPTWPFQSNTILNINAKFI